ALATVALVCPMGHEAAQTQPAPHDFGALCPVQRLLHELLDKWALLWQYGQYQQAERFAVRAVQLCPSNLDAQHALTVTRIVSSSGMATPQACGAPACREVSGHVGVILRTHATQVQEHDTGMGMVGGGYEAGCLPYGHFECEELCQ